MARQALKAAGAPKGSWIRVAVIAFLLISVLSVTAAGIAWWWSRADKKLDDVPRLAEKMPDVADKGPDDGAEAGDRPGLIDITPTELERPGRREILSAQPLVPPVDRTKVPFADVKLPDEKVTLDLPSGFTDVIVGGGGRFLVLPLFRKEEIAIVDVQQAKVVATLPVEGKYPRLAAGLDTLMILYPEKKEMQRWSLLTFKKEATAKLDTHEWYGAMVMGSASNGPLFMLCAPPKNRPEEFNAVFFDIAAMKFIDVDLNKQGERRVGSRDDRIFASDNGSVFTVAGDGGVILRLQGNKIVVRDNWGSLHASPIPGPDGRHLFSNFGVLIDGEREWPMDRGCMPSVQGNLFYSQWNNFGDNQRGVPVHLVGETLPLFFLDDVPMPGLRDFPDKDGKSPWPVPADRRILLMPDAKVMAAIDLTQTKLVLHRFDWREKLAKSNKNHVVVASQPPPFAVLGKTFNYQLDVQSSGAEVKRRLEAGPAGMKLSTTGRLVWDVPKDAKHKSASVAISITNDSGKEIFHTFTVKLVKEWPAWASAPAPLPADTGTFAEVAPAPTASDPEALKLFPAKLDGARVVRDLPGNTRNVVVGGNGRYLILHIPDQRKLLQFDMCEAKVVREYALPEHKIQFAAGLEKLFIHLPNARVLQRWDLTTGKREKTVLSPYPFGIEAMAMGHASRGPLMLAPGLFVDPESMRILDYRSVNENAPFRGRTFQASANGKLFTGCGGDFRPEHLSSILLSGKNAVNHFTPKPVFPALPGPDGDLIYTDWGIFTPALKPVGKAAQNRSQGLHVPGLQGPYYIRFFDKDKSLHYGSDERTLAKLPDSIELPRFGPRDSVYFNPKAQVIVTIDNEVRADQGKKFGANCLTLYRFDPEKAIEDGGTDYFYVTSKPAGTVRQGSAFTYQVATRSRKGGATYKIELGPDGMAVDDAGKVTWNVPPDFADEEAEVILALKDRSNQENLHTFKVKVLGANGKARASDATATIARWHRLGHVDLKRAGMRPAPLKDDTVTVNLPSKVGDVVVGGAGRFLIFHFPKERQIAWFDVNEAKIIHTIPADDEPIHFAAGLEKLIVVLPNKKLLQRWDLFTGKREKVVGVPIDGLVRAAWMGAGSAGPLYVRFSVDADQISPTPHAAIDLQSLKPNAHLQWESRFMRKHVNRDIVHYRASTDGRSFGAWATSHSPQGILTHWFKDRDLVQRSAHESGGHVHPGPDGMWFYTGSGVFTRDLQRPENDTASAGFTVPAHHGPYYLRFKTLEAFGAKGGGRSEPHESSEMSLHVAGEPRPLYTTTNISIPVGAEEFADHDFTSDKRVHLIPQANVLAIIPRSSDRLVLHRFDPDAHLAKAPFDYLFIDSAAPQPALKGQVFEHQMTAKSKQGKVRFQLDAGPEGLTLSADGKLSWAVPKDFDELDAFVIMTVSDASKTTFFHTLRIVVPENDAPAPVVPSKKDQEIRPPQPDEFDKFPPEPGKQGKQEIELKLKAAISEDSKRVALPPAKLEADKVERPLPAPVSEVVVGGGGRWVILPMPSIRHVAVLGVAEAKIVKFLPMLDADAKVAAGADRLLILYPKRKQIESWNLSDCKRAGRESIEMKDHAFATLTMGCEASSPALIVTAEVNDRPDFDIFLLDARTLKRVDLNLREHLHGDRIFDPAVTSDGLTFTVGRHRLRVSPTAVQIRGLADEETIPTSPGGKWQVLQNTILKDGKQVASFNGLCWPAAVGDEFFVAHVRGANERESDIRKGIRIFRYGDKEPVATMPEVDLSNATDRSRHDAPSVRVRVANRWMLVPEADLFMTLNWRNDRLTLYRVPWKRE